MGRTLKRVPLDFAAPLKVVWPGYLNPHVSERCWGCGGDGYNRATHAIAEDFYDFDKRGRRWVDKITQDEVDALVVEGRLMDFTHTWKDGKWTPNGRRPTAAQVNAASGERGMVHDAINRCILIETRAKRLGVWGHCEVCKGEGELWASPELRAASEAWKPTPPPSGEGFQLWETTSEGSPISPVFRTLDALCTWAESGATTCGSYRATASEWRAMLGAGFVAHEEQVPGGPKLVFF